MPGAVFLSGHLWFSRGSVAARFPHALFSINPEIRLCIGPRRGNGGGMPGRHAVSPASACSIPESGQTSGRAGEARKKPGCCAVSLLPLANFLKSGHVSGYTGGTVAASLSLFAGSFGWGDKSCPWSGDSCGWKDGICNYRGHHRQRFNLDSCGWKDGICPLAGGFCRIEGFGVALLRIPRMEGSKGVLVRGFLRTDGWKRLMFGGFMGMAG